MLRIERERAEVFAKFTKNALLLLKTLLLLCHTIWLDTLDSAPFIRYSTARIFFLEYLPCTSRLLYLFQLLFCGMVFVEATSTICRFILLIFFIEREYFETILNDFHRIELDAICPVQWIFH